MAPKRTDPLTPAQRRRTMASVRGKDTMPELAVRRLVHGLGYRYRLHRRELPGKPDLVFPARRKVIFVHGCFWHRHHCRAGAKEPKTNTAYWLPKLAKNKTRDKAHQIKLRRSGWRVLVVWECHLKNEKTLHRRIVKFLESD
jgi:DNA mismatch endonuclease (patch repair protein)